MFWGSESWVFPSSGRWYLLSKPIGECKIRSEPSRFTGKSVDFYLVASNGGWSAYIVNHDKYEI